MNLNERIDAFLVERARREYSCDDQVSAFRDFVETELQEQRQQCWHKSQDFLSQAGAWDCMQGVRDACLNARPEKK